MTNKEIEQMLAELKESVEKINKDLKAISEHLESKATPNWEFTEDEKVILRNLPYGYEWIARDKDNALYAYNKKVKADIEFGQWGIGDLDNMRNMEAFNHLFTCIKWEDDEPCEFRKYI